ARAPSGAKSDAHLSLVTFEPGHLHEADLGRTKAVRSAAWRHVELADGNHPHVAVDLRFAPQRQGRELGPVREKGTNHDVVFDDGVDQLLRPGEAGLVE